MQTNSNEGSNDDEHMDDSDETIKPVTKIIETVTVDPTILSPVAVPDIGTGKPDSWDENESDQQEQQDQQDQQEQSGQDQEETSETKVYYIAAKDGTIASYNPNYIYRKVPGGVECRILLPDRNGTMALRSDIDAELEGYVSKQSLKAALAEAVAQNVPTTNYTLNDVLLSHNKLLTALRNFIS